MEPTTKHFIEKLSFISVNYQTNTENLTWEEDEDEVLAFYKDEIISFEIHTFAQRLGHSTLLNINPTESNDDLELDIWNHKYAILEHLENTHLNIVEDLDPCQYNYIADSKHLSELSQWEFTSQCTDYLS